MWKPLEVAAGVALLFSACAPSISDPPSAPPGWVNVPSSGSPLRADWWNRYNDPDLSGLIQQAWTQNPDITIALAGIEAARADRNQALGMLFPMAGGTLGFGTNREKSRMTHFRAEDMEPWQSEGMLKWELDVTGKGRAMLRAAQSREAAAYARYEGAKLMLASEVAAARFESILMGEEATILLEQAAAETEAFRLAKSLVEGGFADSETLANREADAQAFKRMADDFHRQQSLAKLRLDRLAGGRANSGGKASPVIPPAPTRLPAETFSRRPDLIAAEAELRAAFEMEHAAKLELLPSLSLVVDAGGGQNSLRQRFMTWTAMAGPRLEIPVWDPARLAQVTRGKAAATRAAAQYRSTALDAIEEVEAGYINFTSRQRQYQSSLRETASRKQAFDDANSKKIAGLASGIEATESRHAYYEARRATLRLRLRLLNDHLKLVRALGG